MFSYGRYRRGGKKAAFVSRPGRKQMRKTGQTPFVFDTLEIMTDEAGFLPMQSINELRRKGLEELEKEIFKKVSQSFA